MKLLISILPLALVAVPLATSQGDSLAPVNIASKAEDGSSLSHAKLAEKPDSDLEDQVIQKAEGDNGVNAAGVINSVDTSSGIAPLNGVDPSIKADAAAMPFGADSSEPLDAEAQQLIAAGEALANENTENDFGLGFNFMSMNGILPILCATFAAGLLCSLVALAVHRIRKPNAIVKPTGKKNMSARADSIYFPQKVVSAFKVSHPEMAERNNTLWDANGTLGSVSTPGADLGLSTPRKFPPMIITSPLDGQAMYDSQTHSTGSAIARRGQLTPVNHNRSYSFDSNESG